MEKYKTIINGVAIFGALVLALFAEALPWYGLILAAVALALCGAFLNKINAGE